jgi:phosphohistidine phosphatase
MTPRTLVLLRHAKAEHPPMTADMDRSLSARGHADAAAAGAWLASQGLVPDLVLCSPTRRTRETWHAVELTLDGSPTVVYDPRLYEGGASEMIEAIRDVEQATRTVLVIGHNPTISMVSGVLDPANDVDDGLRTSGLAVHRLAGSWSECGRGEAPLTATHTARA